MPPRFTSGNFVFRSRSRYARLKNFLQLTAKVVDALRGEALSCAMEIGLAKLMEANGLDLLCAESTGTAFFRSEQRKLVSY